ncbi:MAG: hypothetical protein K6A95_08320 [Bacteroidales bacterium]|nr:hypothetical protein [Bacteroidales bacterium]
MRKNFIFIFTLILSISLFSIQNIEAQEVKKKNRTERTPEERDSLRTLRLSRFTIGGYGEATYKYSFYSDNAFRYSFPDRYKDSKGFGQVDLPHVVLMLGYDFGHGWSMGTEIEFEHGGVEAAVEIEAEESGEYEKEIERGGEVALEQFWLQKSFFDGKLNVRAGHIVVPVGATNNSHMPTEFFTVFRPEGENTIIPCTWHETGISLWGKAGAWRYEVQLLPALNSTMFNVQGWAHDASASPYEFRPANNLAAAFRVDNTSVKGLRLGLSGYVGGTFNNDIVTEEHSTKYEGVRGVMFFGAFDFLYKYKRLVLRGNGDFGYLGDADWITRYNNYLPNSSSAPYPHTPVGKMAYDAAVEIGCNTLPLGIRHELYVFARYNYYDSYTPASENVLDFTWTERHVIAVGLNYKPIPEIVIKAEAGYRMMHKQYNNEPWMAIGIAYCGFFNKNLSNQMFN